MIINESSLLLQARWNWADNTVAGKWGREQEVYRKPRLFVADPDQDIGDLQDGAPIVVTRNKIRGRGRSLHLKFQTTPGKDAHLLGWSTNYAILTDNG